MSQDAGLQPERTTLAWRRTGLVGAVAALALARAAVTRGSVVLAIVCLLVLPIAAATLVEGTRALARRRDDEHGVQAPTLPLAGHALVALVVLLSAAGLVVVLVG